MRMKGQFRVFVGFLLLITIGFVRASEENYGTILSEQFKMEVLPRGGFRLEMLMKSSSRSVLPEFIPAQGLNGLAAIPFLLEVLDNGYKLPDEGEEYEGKEVKKRYIFPYANQPEKQKQLTRMYAALCLGAIGDKRAFVPLVSLLSKENKLDDDYYIKYYVATALGYLNDPNSVPYLINVMESVDNTDLQFACMRSLAEYRDMRVIVPILNVFDKKPGAFDIKSIMEFMTKKKIVMTHSKDEKLLKKFMEDRDYGYYRTHKKEVFYFEEFPELEPFSTYPGFEKVWQHWLEGGGREQQNSSGFSMMSTKK